MPKLFTVITTAVLATVVLCLGAPMAANAQGPAAPSLAPNGNVPVRLAPAPTLGPRDWVAPAITDLSFVSTDTGVTVEFDYASVPSPTIPDLFYGGDVTFLAFEGTADTPVRPSPVIGSQPELQEWLDLDLAAQSPTRETGHFTGSFPLDRSKSLVVALYQLESCDNVPGAGVGCGGSDRLFASGVLDDADDDGRIVDRVSGADRFEVAVNISKLAYPQTADVVFVATGANYPDALSAGPAAAKLGGPLLLTTTDSLLPQVEDEIERLDPDQIVVVGGVNSIAPAVFDKLKAIQPDTVRIGGADRYEASRNLADFAFGESGASTAYVATGVNFPDALSAGPAAATRGGPVVLVAGGSPTLDAATASTLTDLHVTDVVIAGGPNSVSAGIETGLKTIATVARDGGADRFAASVNINTRAFPTASRAFLATGLKFPDALSGSAWAGAIDAPLFVSNTACVPSAALAAIDGEGVTHVTLLGGTATLTSSVQALTPCG
ncbi:cell wall-binding repeat-containing protein [Herbiconiux daphne]|uniref:Cell wall-binding repeat-containing protein n=1 Tax=Herbiconiux daphne TaxID=2970914 RepID=A0ABT2H518_9MICO|nr:cell wall-binding repeat-containing protein [Herbiconiux daphne]MCS5735037.1 cell wall-binding repeat-containing protein [Herbiconiux daphne]